MRRWPRRADTASTGPVRGGWRPARPSAHSTIRAPLKVLVGFELPAPVRVERLLMLGLGLSRSGVRRMVGDGRIHLPLALDAKVHRDFELTIHDLGSVDAAKHSKLLGAPTDVRTDLSRVGLHGTPQHVSRSAAGA